MDQTSTQLQDLPATATAHHVTAINPHLTPRIDRVVTTAPSVVMPQLEPHATRTVGAHDAKTHTQPTNVSAPIESAASVKGIEIVRTVVATAAVAIVAPPTTSVTETTRHGVVQQPVCTRGPTILARLTDRGLLEAPRLLVTIVKQSRKLVRVLVRSRGGIVASSASTLDLGVAAARAAIGSRRRTTGSVTVSMP